VQRHQRVVDHVGRLLEGAGPVAVGAGHGEFAASSPSFLRRLLRFASSSRVYERLVSAVSTADARAAITASSRASASAASGSSPKQLVVPSRHAGPSGAMRASTASRSQSVCNDTTRWVWPLVSPLRHSPRVREPVVHEPWPGEGALERLAVRMRDPSAPHRSHGPARRR
jgi:hypothetical protein